MSLDLINAVGQLDLSAEEIVTLTTEAGATWPPALVEDYLARARALDQVILVIDDSFGTMALQDADDVAITGGSIAGVTLSAVSVTTPLLSADSATITTLTADSATIAALTVGTLNIGDVTVDNLTVNGNATLGNAATDFVLVNAGTVTYANGVVIVGTQYFVNDVTLQNALTFTTSPFAQVTGLAAQVAARVAVGV